VIFFKKILQKFWQNQKLPYLCIVDVGNTTENKDVRNPNLQSDRRVSGVLIRVKILNLIDENF
jgi:hypothetical protein